MPVIDPGFRKNLVYFGLDRIPSKEYTLHHLMSTQIQPAIDSADICERLVGITPVYLQNFVQRGSYGIRSSVQPGKVRSKRRLFSRDDVFGLALVWLLFESGLRGDPLARILNDITGSKKADANLAAKKLLTSQGDYLLIARKPRGPTKAPLEKPEQSVKSIKQSELTAAVDREQAADLIIIPVGQKFADIRRRMEILFGG